VVTNHASKIIRAETLPGISNYDISFVKFDITHEKKTPNQIPREISLYGKTNWETIKKELEDTNNCIKNQSLINLIANSNRLSQRRLT
jgi:hypothetical protein